MVVDVEHPLIKITGEVVEAELTPTARPARLNTNANTTTTTNDDKRVVVFNKEEYDRDQV